MTRFFVIDSTSPSKSISARESWRLLRESCVQKKIEFVDIDVSLFDFTNYDTPKPGDLLYRISTSSNAKIIEKLLISNQTSTFYTDGVKGAIPDIDNVIAATILHQKVGIPMPKTIFNLPKTKEEASEAVDYLGGFPIIIKAAGGSHGIGVMKIDSMAGFLSVKDFLQSIQPKHHFILREYIQVRSSARLIVLGDTVIDSIEYISADDDFRSNEGAKPNVQIKEFSTEIQQIAIKATQARGVEFSGTDILIDANGKPYLTEVNSPCYFPRCQNLSGVDISGQMIDYLSAKAKRIG